MTAFYNISYEKKKRKRKRSYVKGETSVEDVFSRVLSRVNG